VTLPTRTCAGGCSTLQIISVRMPSQAQVLQALSELADRVRLGAPAPHLVPQPFHHAPTSPLRAARTWMIIDADDCQGSTCGHGPPSAEQATSLFESVVHKWQRQCLAFVQVGSYRRRRRRILSGQSIFEGHG